MQWKSKATICWGGSSTAVPTIKKLSPQQMVQQPPRQNNATKTIQLERKSPRAATRGLECLEYADGEGIDYFTLVSLILAAISWY
jgi:hypothetical protein